MKYYGIKKILLIRMRSLGDLITVTPCTKAVKDTYPDCSLSVMVEDGFSDIFINNPFVDNLLVISKSDKTFLGQIKFLYKVRRCRFDMIINLHGGPRSCMIILFSGARYRVGGLQKPHHLNWIFNIRVAPFDKIFGSEGSRNIVKRHLATLACAGIESHSTELIFNLSSSNKQYIKSILDRYNPSSMPVISLHLPMSEGVKRISFNKAALLADTLIDRFSVCIIFTGGHKEKDTNSKICSMMKNRAYNMAGKTTVGQLAALYKSSAFFIGLDSGPSHVAASVGTYLIILFGSTNVSTWRPWTDKITVIIKDYECIGCGKKVCPKGDIPKCLEDIRTEEIISAVENRIELLHGY